MLIGKEPQSVKAFITNRGDLIKVNKADANQTETQKLPQDLFGEHYRSGRVARPPYNPSELIQLLETSTYHYKCVKQKALDTVGAYSVVEVDKEKDKSIKAQKGKKEKLDESGRQTILDFIKNCNPVLSFQQITKALMVDFEAIGWFVLEVIRNRKGEIVGLNHIPAHTCRFLLDGTGILHRRNNQERIFKFFGDKEVRIDPNTQLPCNEVIYRFDYSPRSDYYGIPDYIPSVGAMLANTEIRDFNLKFFENGAVPQYAVILEGGELDEGTEEVIKSHFRDNLKGTGNSHKTLVISTPEGGKVNFQPLAVDVKDGHFRLYRTDNRDEIIHAHGVPPYRIGIAETGSLGGNVAEEMTEIYKNSVITPKQYMMEEVFAKIFSDESFSSKGVADWKLEFDEIDTQDEKLEAEIKEIRVRTAKSAKEAGVYTPDEIRQIAGDEAYADNDDIDNEIKEWASTPIGFEPQEPQDDETGFEGENTQSEFEGDSEANEGGSEGSSLDQYSQILNDYRKEGIVRKSLQKIKKLFKVNSERVWESVKKSKEGSEEIRKSKFSFRKKKKVARDEFEIEDLFKDKLVNMFQNMKQKLFDKLEKIEQSYNSKIEKSDFETMISSEEFKALYPEIWKEVSGIMSPTELAEVMYEMMVMGIEFGLADTLRETNEMGKKINWKLYDKNISKFLDEYTFKASQKTMDRITGNVLEQIKTGQENGESIQTIMGRLNTVFENLTSYETERIARTETIKSSNAGRFESYKMMGVPEKVWLGRDDGRERESHIAMNYEVVPLMEPFSNGLMYPGDPNGEAKEVINCRCAIGAIFPENKQMYTEKYSQKNKGGER